MGIILAKKKKEDIDEAEIIVSDDPKRDKTNVYKFNPHFTVFYVLLIIIFSLLIYYERKLSFQIEDFKAEIESLSPPISLETIDGKLRALEVSIFEENLQSIDKAIRNLEEKFTVKIDYLSGSKISIDDIKSIKEDFLNLKLQFEEKVSKRNFSFDELLNMETVNFVNDTELDKQLKLLITTFEKKIEILENRFDKIRLEVISLQKQLRSKNSVNITKLEEKLFLNVKTLAELKESFPRIATSALRIEAKNNYSGGFWSRLASTINSIFIFRSTTPREGSNTDAILSRAEYELNKGNFQGCLEELSLLDERVAFLFFDWKKSLIQLINEID